MHALRGKEFIEYDNPFDVGMTGLLGFASGYKAIKEADALLMLGTDFPYQQFYPDHAKVIQVDIRGRNLGRRTPIDLGLVGTVKDTLAALQPLLRQKARRDHLDRSLRHYRKTRKTLDELAVNDRDRTPIRPEYVAGLANRLAADDAVFTVDVGSPVVWAARYLTMNGRRRLIGSFNHGTMACALPHGDRRADRVPRPPGGRAGRRRRPDDVVRRADDADPEPVAGQGDRLQQLVAELRRAGDEGRRHRQLRHRPGQPRLRGRRARRWVSSAGAWSSRPTWSRRWPTRSRTTVPPFVDVVTARQELSIPPAITVEQAKGFSLYAIRTILAGRGDELLDLITTNVARRILD